MLLNHDADHLLPGAPEAVNVHAVYVVGSGWHLDISVRRQFQEWAQASRGRYELLSTSELLSVVESSLGWELER